MAFVPLGQGYSSRANTKIDIIGIPAIYADPNTTWYSYRDGAPHQWLGPELINEIPSARVLLYDHLKPAERAVEVEPSSSDQHKTSSRDYALIQGTLSHLRIEEWAMRLLRAIHEYRSTASLQQRPLLFICHSTGGIVLKKALTMRYAESDESLAAVSLGIVFLATPHHGSSVLSKTEFTQAVKNVLNLKFEMSEELQEQFSVENLELAMLNHKFGAVSLGIKIWNVIEKMETMLQVLTAVDASGESLTTVNLCIVDSRSSRTSTPDVLIEEEENISVDTTHVGTAGLADDNTLRLGFCAILNSFVVSNSAQDRAAHHNLTTSILAEVHVDVHQFYEMNIVAEKASIKVWSENPSLQDFLEHGPAECLRRRLHVPWAESAEPLANGTAISEPHVRVRKPSEESPTFRNEPPSSAPGVSAPTITVDSVNDETSEKSSQDHDAGSTLAAPTIVFPKNIHTRRPSLSPRASAGSKSMSLPLLRRLEPSIPMHGPEMVQTNRDTNGPLLEELSERPRKARTYQAPTQSNDRFRWIHVPCNNSNWVPQVLSRISQEKGVSALHSTLLSDECWGSLHNRSRHASSHARFVRPHCKVLLPQSSYAKSGEGMLSPSSANEQVQFALYIPYLHWDTFHHLQWRSAVIKKRGPHVHVRPIDQEIATGNSLEGKLIWQYLNSKWPLHCRRTLDQYGYPTLRNTEARDIDQVLYKRTKPQEVELVAARDPSMRNIGSILHAVRASGPRPSKIRTVTEDMGAKVLMIDQLWCWITDDENVVTFASGIERSHDEGIVYREGDVKENIYRDVNGDHARQCEDCFDFAALAVFHAVKALLDYTTEDPNLQVFRIFEEYISILTEQQTKSFKEFRDNHRYRDPEDVDVKRLPKYVDNREDLNALLELRDIEDELNTISKLLTEQHKCVTEMLKQYRHLNHKYQKGSMGTFFLREVNQTLTGYEEQVAGMLKSSSAAQDAFQKLLDMKQKQANIVEAHLAREQTEVAANQSRSVMIFTIFTIIFLPLSFFASVFGMNLKEWSGTETNITLQTAFTYMGAISIAVIIVALLVAFNRFSRRITLRIWKVVAKPLTNILDRIPSQRLQNYLHYDPNDPEMAVIPDPQSRNMSKSRSARRSTVFELETFGKFNLD